MSKRNQRAANSQVQTYNNNQSPSIFSYLNNSTTLQQTLPNHIPRTLNQISLYRTPVVRTGVTRRLDVSELKNEEKRRVKIHRHIHLLLLHQVVVCLGNVSYTHHLRKLKKRQTSGVELYQIYVIKSRQL